MVHGAPESRPRTATVANMFTHEQLVVRRGSRTGFPIVVAVHSSVLGQAIGGCRLRHYARWQDGVADALDLAAGMSYKCALAGLSHGGGKSVIVNPVPEAPTGDLRRAALRDLGDLIASLDGAYATGPDVGTGPDDMVTIAERTGHVFCLPAGHGGSGDSGAPTARGVLAAVRAACAHRFGSADLAGRTVTVIGLGSVGGRIARALDAAGATVTGSDIDPAKGPAMTPAEALRAPADVLVPAAMGGLLTADVVADLRSAVIVGPANNQLADDSVADLLHARGVLWVPDYVASAGGVVHAVAVERDGLPVEAALAAVDRIGDTVTDVLRSAAKAGISPHEAAHRQARARLSAAGKALERAAGY